MSESRKITHVDLSNALLRYREIDPDGLSPFIDELGEGLVLLDGTFDLAVLASILRGDQEPHEVYSEG